jgi:hypothetical protein
LIKVVGGIATTDFFMGMFGLKPASSNFSTFNDPVPSYMSSLKTQNKIPSLTYGYTAGNQYRFNKVLGSLTLGGYDASLFEFNEVTYTFNADSSFYLTVNIDAIMFSGDSGNKPLSPEPFSACVDSTVPYLYLRISVCEQFEDAFGLTYDNVSELYLVNDTLHSKLLAESANVTFPLRMRLGKLESTLYSHIKYSI